MHDEWIKVDEVNGAITAEVFRGMLEAHGITVWLNQEGVGRVYGLGISNLGLVPIMTPASQAEKARQIIADYYKGLLESDTSLTDEGGEGELEAP